MPAVGGQTGDLLAGSLALAAVAAVMALLFKGAGPTADWVRRLACLLVALGLGLALSAAPGLEAARTISFGETGGQPVIILASMGLGILASCWVVLGPTRTERLLGLVGVALANTLIAYCLMGGEGAMCAVLSAAGLGWLGRTGMGERRALAASKDGQTPITNDRPLHGVDVVIPVIACLGVLWPVLQVDWSIRPGTNVAGPSDEQRFSEMIWNEEVGVTISAAVLACWFVWQVVAGLKRQDGPHDNVIH